MNNPQAKQRRYAPIVFLALLAIASARIAATYTIFNDTVDEPEHIASGMQWLDEGVYRYEIQNPPLARVMEALGPYLAGLRSYGNEDGWTEGRLILDSEGRYERNLMLARLGTLPFFWLACSVVFVWTRRVFGDAAACLAVLCFTTLPPILAHAALATTDMAATGTISAAFLALLMWAEPTSPGCPKSRAATSDATHGTVSAATGIPESSAHSMSSMSRFGLMRCLVLGTTLALAVLSKFTALVFLPAAALAALAFYLLAERPRPEQVSDWLRPRLAPMAIAVFTACVLIWAGYRFSFHGLPAPELWRGLRELKEHNSLGHPAYLLGHIRMGGWWYYFPIALGVKTPIAFLFLLAPGGIACWKLRRETRRASFIPAAFVLGILFFTMLFSRVNIGVRHVLPVYAGLAVIAGAGARYLWSSGPAPRMAMASLLAWMAVSSGLGHPDYLAYFNAFAGREPERVLIDSDLDWGQDTKRLAQRLMAAGAKEVAFDPFNKGYVQFLQTQHQFPAVKPLSPDGPAPGWNAASITMLKFERMGNNNPGTYRWTDRIPPTERVGKGILLWYSVKR